MRLGFSAKAGCEQLIPYPPKGTDNSKDHENDENDQFRAHGYEPALFMKTSTATVCLCVSARRQADLPLQQV
jgi:hypothetical protein